MKTRICLLCICLLTVVPLQIYAQYEASGETLLKQPKFKPHYSGTMIDAGMMFTSGFGPAYYVAPKISFQATPRLFLNAGVGVMQHSLLPSQAEVSQNRNTTSVYLFAEGQYFVTDRLSINGSVMKDVSSGPLRQVSPYSVPSEAMHIGVDYKITPNITVGARIGYSNGGHRNSMFGPFYPY